MEFGSDIDHTSFKMASSALEEKINKIKQQNEEIRRRYQEVEEDKKIAAKLNALVQMVPSTDWPERKEPPEFNLPIKIKQKPVNKEHRDEHHFQQHYINNSEGKKIHTFPQGEGPPPDPKYNFLADHEREEFNSENVKGNVPNKNRNRNLRGNPKRKQMGRDSLYKDNKGNHEVSKGDTQPEYEAWRAERNRIDEDRISRQKTAEGHWRREWDNDKFHLANNSSKRDLWNVTDIKRDHRHHEGRHYEGNNYANRSAGTYRANRGSKGNTYNSHEHRHNISHESQNYIPSDRDTVLQCGNEERTITATNKTIKVTVNQGNPTKGPVMSVKVNSPNIAGTGRVGPRQRTRITYSSHSDVEVHPQNVQSSSQQTLTDDKSKVNFNSQKQTLFRRPQQQRKNENNSKSSFMRKDHIKKDNDILKSSCSLEPSNFLKPVRLLTSDVETEVSSNAELLPEYTLTQNEESNLNIDESSEINDSKCFSDKDQTTSCSTSKIIHSNIISQNEKEEIECDNITVEIKSESNAIDSLKPNIGDSNSNNINTSGLISCNNENVKDDTIICESEANNEVSDKNIGNDSNKINIIENEKVVNPENVIPQQYELSEICQSIEQSSSEIDNKTVELDLGKNEEDLENEMTTQNCNEKYLDDSVQKLTVIKNDEMLDNFKENSEESNKSLKVEKTEQLLNVEIDAVGNDQIDNDLKSQSEIHEQCDLPKDQSENSSVTRDNQTNDETVAN